MATALEKVGALADQLADMDDDELQETTGLPLFMARPAVALLPRMMPATNEELEQKLESARGFIDSLRSDPVELDA